MEEGGVPVFTLKYKDGSFRSNHLNRFEQYGEEDLPITPVLKLDKYNFIFVLYGITEMSSIKLPDGQSVPSTKGFLSF
jgi:uncharacterized protein (UPF0218 family)